VDLTVRTCPKCGAHAADGDRFCEIDGTALAVARPTATEPASSATVCARCGAAAPDDDGYCSACGHRMRPAPATPGGSGVRTIASEDVDVRLEEAPGMAGCTHPGLRHLQNEDAVALAAGRTPLGEAFRILVVCDGVSSSTFPERASQLAARVVRDTLSHVCRVGDLAFEGARAAVVEAIRSAHVAVCSEGIDGPAGPPGTTCVAALVVDDRLTVGWVGDSRAYWLTERGAELLTRDHSWVNEAVDRGEATLEEALRSSYAHALTRCLGPLETAEGDGSFAVDVVTRRLAGPGWLLLCSDGLWNYAPDADAMALLVRRGGASPGPAQLARALVHEALVLGGHDNVSVAALSCGVGP
jgi:serine/threonine protein phosphatase PrpC